MASGNSSKVRQVVTAVISHLSPVATAAADRAAVPGDRRSGGRVGGAGTAVKLKLYSFWRSSSSQHVRIALNLKGLAYDYKPVNLHAKEHSDPEFERLNPIKYVPALVDGDTVIADSFAILLYLEDMYPQHSLLPQDPKKRALNIQIASIVGSSIQPLQNDPVLNFIEEKLDSN